jgi:RND superfamily putative drug exporter
VTERAARACARHPWRTIAVWLVVLVVAVLAAGALLGDGLTGDETLTNDPDSVLAKDLLEERLGEGELGTEVIVVRAAEAVDAPGVQTAVARLVDDLRRSGAVEDVRIEPQAPLPDQVSSDRRALLIPLQLVDPPEDHVDAVIAVVEAADGRDGLSVAITGEFTLSHDFDKIAESDLQEGEFRIGFPAALIVLILVFGALVAAALPLILAIVSIAVALGLTAIVSQGFSLSFFVVNMVVAMGLALGIDYALFVVSRVREERAAGRDSVEAIVAAGSTASRAVLFSGSAFVLAMLGLLMVPSSVMRSLAAGAILVGVVAVAAALTLLPALLRLLGDRINSLRVPWVGPRLERPRAQEGRFWVRIVRVVTAHPAVSLLCAVAVLLAAASPLLTMNIGAAEVGTLPDSAVTKQGLIALQESFPQASAEPAEVVVDGPVGDPEVRAAFARLEASLADDPRFGPAELVEFPERDLSIMRVQMGGDPLSDQALSAVRDLRSDLVPAAFAGTDAAALVGGPTAINIDYFDVMERWLPLVICFVLGLSLVLLTVAFRSAVIAATSIVMNLLSVGAAYGLLVLVFQHGVATDLLGFQQVDTIEAWVPLFLFAVLFGLSMDYQVFLLSRIRERYTETGDTRDAVIFGIGSTARIITGAALIIVAVFIGFAAGELVMFQQMGFGIAVALLIDATIVRSVLVPATMALLGKWNWYLPRWLDWLPHIEVEGAHGGPAYRAP